MKMMMLAVIVGLVLLCGCTSQNSNQQNITLQGSISNISVENKSIANQTGAIAENKTIIENQTILDQTGVSMMNEIVVIETSKGNIEVELNMAKSPITVANFLKYVESGFYNSTVFHRVIKGFMVQGGGFTRGGMEKDTLDPIKLESNNGLSNLKGTVAMARTNVPDSATSQFFINTVDNGFLNYQSQGNPGYAVFGKVISGMDVVLAIEASKTGTKGGYEDWPVEDIIITNAYVKK
jgi:peptidyl-prolyl cis-trans isomerase B (cyclophilin B)